MSDKMNKARAGLGGMFVIGLVFTIVGVSTSNAGFYVPGIVFLVIGLGGIVCAKKKSKGSTEEDRAQE
jgi:uncharacterized membrane protein YuzA (DUF378 family)